MNTPSNLSPAQVAAFDQLNVAFLDTLELARAMYATQATGTAPIEQGRALVEHLEAMPTATIYNLAAWAFSALAAAGFNPPSVRRTFDVDTGDIDDRDLGEPGSEPSA